MRANSAQLSTRNSQTHQKKRGILANHPPPSLLYQLYAAVKLTSPLTHKRLYAVVVSQKSLFQLAYAFFYAYFNKGFYAVAVKRRRRKGGYSHCYVVRSSHLLHNLQFSFLESTLNSSPFYTVLHRGPFYTTTFRPNREDSLHSTVYLVCKDR